MDRRLKMALEIKNIHKDAKINIQGGVVVDGFPSTGLANAIASECLRKRNK
jgi:hypothetical protein